ncbi:MAG: 3,4-dihydroxy-2-butanone-4-phosphate synthase [Vicinamibacterales bacterium]
MVRAGQTEAAVDLARIAGLYPAGVICEIMNEDGTMARMPELVKFAKKHRLLIITIADLIKFTHRHRVARQEAREREAPDRVRRQLDHPRLREPIGQEGARRARLRRYLVREERDGSGPLLVSHG